MMRSLPLAAGLAGLVSAPCAADADSVVAARTLRARTVLTAADVAVSPLDMQGAARRVGDVLGFETRVAVFQGRPLRTADLGPAAIVDRNQTVTLIYLSGGLSIIAEGRSLGRGGKGDRIRVMNLASGASVLGTVRADGRVGVN